MIQSVAGIKAINVLGILSVWNDILMMKCPNIIPSIWLINMCLQKEIFFHLYKSFLIYYSDIVTFEILIKFIFQDLWKLQLSWGDTVSDNFDQKWKILCQAIILLY